jgi:hypothetical protein
LSGHGVVIQINFERGTECELEGHHSDKVKKLPYISILYYLYYASPRRTHDMEMMRSSQPAEASVKKMRETLRIPKTIVAIAKNGHEAPVA